MKVLHTADVHLGVKINKLEKEKSTLMKDEMLEQFINLLENAAEYSVVLICGDLFHSKQVSAKLLKGFYDAVKVFGRPILYVEGNHDEKFIFDENKPDNFIILNQKNNYFSFEGVNFYSEGKIEELNKDEINVLLLHGNIDNASDRDYVDINKYADKGFDYIALGHIHQFSERKIGNTPVVYSGSLFSNGFDECGDKGYVNIEFLDNKLNSFQFIPFAKRRFIICECDISGFGTNGEVIKKINLALEESNSTKKDLIRVILKGKLDEDNNISSILINDFFEDYFYFEVKDNTTLEIDFEKIKNEKLSFKYEFISLIENSEELSIEQKNLISRLGIEALKGEDLSL